MTPGTITPALLRSLAPPLLPVLLGACVLALVTILAPAAARAVPYHYVDWTSANVAGGTASGVITLPDSSTVAVTFEAINANGTPGNLFFAQTGGTGTNYWAANGGAPYISPEVDNAPPDSDIVALVGGVNQTYRVTLSEAIRDPIMALVSLGSTSIPTTYDFDSPFAIVSQGPGHWGGTATSLQQLPDDVLRGAEGHGTIQFIGTFSTFTWVVPTPETWHGFTFGIRTTEAIEPTPVPEPAALALFGLGLAAIGLAGRRGGRRGRRRVEGNMQRGKIACRAGSQRASASRGPWGI